MLPRQQPGLGMHGGEVVAHRRRLAHHMIVPTVVVDDRRNLPHRIGRE